MGVIDTGRIVWPYVRHGGSFWFRQITPYTSEAVREAIRWFKTKETRWQVTHFLGYPEEHGGEMCWSYAQGMIYCGFRPCHSVLIG